MYESVKQIGVFPFLAREAIPLGISLIIAELFYKFHSFTLETLALLATWYAISAISSRLLNRKSE